MISVFRIYIGRAWRNTGTESKLKSLFDKVPEFLYSATTCDEGGSTQQSEQERRGAIRVAMTHAHVAVLLAHDVASAQHWTEDEISVARRAFRWRVPILGIVAERGEAARGIVMRAADQVVSAHGADVARAIKDLATAAQAERKSDIERLAKRDVGVMGMLPVDPTGEPASRPLPYGEIEDAFHQMRNGWDQRLR